MTKQAHRDPIRTELLKNALGAIADEMAATVMRTARSSVVKEAMDFSTGLLDPDGELIAQGLCLPLHMGSFPPAIEGVLREFAGGLQPGDIYVLNDPYVGGGTHLPDIYVFQPIFWEQRLLGFAAAIVHVPDIGGRVPGGNASDSTEIFQEGLRIPPLKLFDRGVANQTLFKMLRINVRVPDKVIGDVMATIAACRRGEAGLMDLARRYGADRLKSNMKQLLDYAEELTRAELAALPDGEWDFEDFLDDDGFDRTPIRIYVKLSKSGGQLTADFRGTSKQVRGAINTTYPYVNSCVYAVVRCVLDPSIPNNAGFMRPISVILESGSLLNCLPPAPVAARGVTAMRVADTMWGALSKMLPRKVFACGVGADLAVTIAGYWPDGRPFVHLEFLYGNWGGGSNSDGIDAASSLVTNYSNTPVEVLESEHPIRIDRYGYRPDSGGPGQHRGGLGTIRDYRLVDVDEAVLQVRIDRQTFPPYGLYGGRPGAFAESILDQGTDAERALQGKFTTSLRSGQTFHAALAGGGGWGPPTERDPEAVLSDVLNEKVSSEAGSRDYGVVIDLERLEVDYPATRELRSAMKRSSEVGARGTLEGRIDVSSGEASETAPGS